MLLTNLLLACGLSTAVGSGLALKENSNYLHHEKPQEQLHSDNKKNAVTGDIQADTWYELDLSSIYSNNGTNISADFCLNLIDSNSYLYSFGYLDELEIVYYDSENIEYNLSTDFGSLNITGDSNTFEHIYFMSYSTILGSSTDLDDYLLSTDYGGSTTQEVFEVVGDTTTGFIDVLTSAIQNGTELIYKDGNFTFLGVMLLVATGVSVVFWIFRLLRGITEGVSR